MVYIHRTLFRAASILLVACGLFISGCSFDTPDIGHLADEAVRDVQREGSDLLSGEDTAANGGSHTVTVERAVDGDTLEIQPAVEGKTDVRLIGVDTPELDGSQPLSKEASGFTAERLEGERVRLTPGIESEDPYGRLLATLKLEGDQRTHGERLLEAGYAQTLWYEPNTTNRSLYGNIQEKARQRGAGIWGLTVEQRCQLSDNDNGIGQGSAECSGS